MKTGTDGVLLGAWVDVSSANSIMDIGTGTGIIALMCAQRSRKARIDAVEIDPQAAKQASENFQRSPWSFRINAINDSFQHYALAQNRYDVLVSNPPFFRNSLKPPGASRSIARHDDQLSLEALFHACASLLNPAGRIALIYPAGEVDYAFSVAYFNGFYPIRKTSVKPFQDGNFTRCLLEFSNNPGIPCKTDELVIKNTDNEYTGEFRELTQEFYLHF